MPTPYLKKLNKQGKGSIKELEHKWDKAEEIADKAGQGDNYAYRTGILKKMVGIKGNAGDAQIGENPNVGTDAQPNNLMITPALVDEGQREIFDEATRLADSESRVSMPVASVKPTQSAESVRRTREARATAAVQAAQKRAGASPQPQTNIHANATGRRSQTAVAQPQKRAVARAAKRVIANAMRQSAGCLIMAQDTGRFNMARRSAYVDEPLLWSTWGGGVDDGENVQQALRREIMEEAGYTGPMHIIPLWINRPTDNFEYHNHLVVVPKEFEPEMNYENDKHLWFKWGEFPQPCHPGVIALLKDNASRAAIVAALKQRDQLQIPTFDNQAETEASPYEGVPTVASITTKTQSKGKTMSQLNASVRLAAAAKIQAAPNPAAPKKMNPVQFMKAIVDIRRENGLPRLTSEQAEIVTKSHKAGLGLGQTLNLLEQVQAKSVKAGKAGKVVKADFSGKNSVDLQKYVEKIFPGHINYTDESHGPSTSGIVTGVLKKAADSAALRRLLVQEGWTQYHRPTLGVYWFFSDARPRARIQVFKPDEKKQVKVQLDYGQV